MRREKPKELETTEANPETKLEPLSLFSLCLQFPQNNFKLSNFDKTTDLERFLSEYSDLNKQITFVPHTFTTFTTFSVFNAVFGVLGVTILICNVCISLNLH